LAPLFLPKGKNMTTKNDLIVSGLYGTQALGVVGTVATGIAAAGTTITTGTALTADINVVSTVVASTTDGVTLPTNRVAGDTVVVANTSAATLKVYGSATASTGVINGGTAGAAYSLSTVTVAKFIKVDDTAATWIAIKGA
jgi:hypothetical protein